MPSLCVQKEAANSPSSSIKDTNSGINESVLDIERESGRNVFEEASKNSDEHWRVGGIGPATGLQSSNATGGILDRGVRMVAGDSRAPNAHCVCLNLQIVFPSKS